jgi:hypothetical protein
MTHRKNRARVAQIAAGAVFVLGASLTAVGTAQAAGADDHSGPSQGCGLLCGSGDDGKGDLGVKAGVKAGVDVGVGVGVGSGADKGAGGSDQGSQPPSLLGGSSQSPSQSPSPAPPQALPQALPQTLPQSSGSAGTPAGGSSKTGSSSGGDSGSACTLGRDSVNCGGNSNTSTDNNTAPQEISQGQAKQQLAVTGSSGTEFLLIGAATMIAGGVAFRLMPRLANRRTAA